MLHYYGIPVTNKEMDKIENIVNKINKFFIIAPTITLNSKENNDIIYVTVSCSYHGNSLLGKGSSKDKFVAFREATDDLVRQIRKIKTKHESKRYGLNPDVEIPEKNADATSTDMYQNKQKIVQRSLSTSIMTDEAAVDNLNAEDLNFVIFRTKNDELKILTRNKSDGYTSFTIN